MVKTLYYIFKEIRPRQWAKNVVVFFAIFFTGELFNPLAFWQSTQVFITFCLVSSSIYIINDLIDEEKDKLHPFKRNRPIASGKLSKKVALITSAILATLGLYLAVSISTNFLFLIFGFYALQFAYSYYLKDISLLDILAIALGFILRYVGGEIATGYHISVWLLLTIISGALFIAIGKRRSELTLLSGWQGSIPAKTRATLLHYSEKMLDVYIAMFANSTWLTYAFYAFFQTPPVIRNKIGSLLFQFDPDILAGRKWLMLTIPMAIYGVMRYLQLVYEKNVGESPEKVLLSDRPLIITSIIMGLSLFVIMYVVGK